MQERLRGYVDNIKEKWNSLEKSQQVKLVITVLILLVTIVATVVITTRQKRVVLMSKLSWETIAEIQTALNDANIYNKMVQNGTAIEVYEKDAAVAGVTLSSKNVPAGTGFTYEDALSFSGMGTTETIKKENLKQVKQSDLSRSLTLFDGVSSAIVNLIIPDEDNFFLESTKKATASVVLNVTRVLDQKEGMAIARYLSRGVSGLEMDSIEIYDQNANTVYSAYQEEAGTSGSEYEQEMLRKKEIETKIKAALAPLFDEVHVVSNLKLNWNKVQENIVEYQNPVEDSQTGLISRDTTESRSVTNATADGQPGLTANDNAQANYETNTGETSTANERNRDTDYLHNRVERQIQSSVGEVVTDQSSVGVMVYNYKVYDEDIMTRNNQLGDMTWIEFKEANSAKTAFTLDQGVLDLISKSTGITDISMTGYVSPIFKDAVVTPLKIDQIAVFVILALLILLLAYGLIRKTQPDEITEIEPELSVEDLIVSTQLEEQKAAEIEEMQELSFDNESEAKKQIEKFITERPEAVAQLLRNWLNDEWE